MADLRDTMLQQGLQASVDAVDEFKQNCSATYELMLLLIPEEELRLGLEGIALRGIHKGMEIITGLK
jgi:hypothetical protein